MDTSERVVRVANGGFASNTYLYLSREPGHCIVIDPGLDLAAIEAALRRHAVVPDAVYATHGHFDHLAGAEPLRRAYDAPVHLHGADRRVAASSNLLMMALKLDRRMTVPEKFVAIDEGVTWEESGVRVEAIHVPGHTPGSCLLIVDGLAFTGDTIYRDDTFLVRLPEQDTPRLIRSIESVWNRLPDGALVYPGHGRAGTFGEIKAGNMPLRRLLGIDASPAA
jgi:glyoxylase-like metal-dependent hydrolase (beta-lactamase superfamily II)